MGLGAKAVAAGEIALARSGAEVGVFHRSAAHADEVVVMLGAAADVGRAPIPGEGVERACSAEELEGSIGRRQTEAG
jgi:hypothetical protein